MFRERNRMPKFEACSRIWKRLVTIYHLQFFVVCVLPAQKKIKHRQQETEIVTRRFRMRLRTSNFSIQFLSRNNKVFNSKLFWN